MFILLGTCQQFIRSGITYNNACSCRVAFILTSNEYNIIMFPTEIHCFLKIKNNIKN